MVRGEDSDNVYGYDDDDDDDKIDAEMRDALIVREEER